MTEELWRAVMDRAFWRCENCGAEAGRWDRGRQTILEAHHRLMRSQGGPDTLENLVALCRDCHTAGPDAVHRNPAQAYASGLLIRQACGPPAQRWLKAC